MPEEAPSHVSYKFDGFYHNLSIRACFFPPPASLLLSPNLPVMPIQASPSIDTDPGRAEAILPRMGPITNSLSPATQCDVLGILQREQDRAMALLSSSPLLTSLFVSYANQAAALESASAIPSPESEGWKALRNTTVALREEVGKLKLENFKMAEGLRAAADSQKAFRSQVSSLKEVNTTQENEIKSLRAELADAKDKYDRLLENSNTEKATLQGRVLNLETQRVELKGAVVEQPVKILKLERQDFELTTELPPNSTLPSPTREVPPHLPRSKAASPTHSIRSPSRQSIHSPPIIRRPVPQHPPLPSVIPPSGRHESDLGYAAYNRVPAETRRQPRRLPQGAQSPPLVANPPHNSEPIAMAVPEPQSQEASQVSQPSRVSQALSNLPPPEYTTEDKYEYRSDLGSSQYDELDTFTTPPNLAKGPAINNDFVDDPLMTPPGNGVARDMTGIGSWFGGINWRRGRSRHRSFPISASRQENALYTEGDNLDDPAPVPTHSTKHKKTKSSAGLSMIPARSNSVWGGSSVDVSEPAVGPPPSPIRVSGSVWGNSVKDEEPTTSRVRDQSIFKSNPGSIRGSIWGGSTLDEGFVRDGDNVSVTGGLTRSGLDDVESARGQHVPLEDSDIQKELNRRAESGSTPTSTESAASISDSTNLRNEKPSVEELPLLTTPEDPTKPADPITKSVEGMRFEEALKTTTDAWDQAVRIRAPELKIVVGLGKAATQLKRRITKSLEDEYNVSPSKVNLREVIFKLPNIPPAISDNDVNPQA